MNLQSQNPLLSPSFGWLFVALSCLFLPGLLPRLARGVYPGGAGIVGRAAAPVLFALVAAACFGGLGIEALAAVVVGGLVLIVATRQTGQRRKRALQNRL